MPQHKAAGYPTLKGCTAAHRTRTRAAPAGGQPWAQPPPYGCGRQPEKLQGSTKQKSRNVRNAQGSQREKKILPQKQPPHFRLLWFISGSELATPAAGVTTRIGLQRGIGCCMSVRC